MEPISVTGCDLKFSRFALGTWRAGSMDIEAILEWLHHAIDLGVTTIDTADVYGYGEAIGFGGVEKLLGKAFQIDSGLRQQLTLMTKGGVDLPSPYNSSRNYLEDAIDASLDRLGIDEIDVYFIHRPDLMTHPAKVAEALNNAVANGKVRHIGLSNYSSSQVRALSVYLDKKVIAAQPELSAYHQQPIFDGVLDWCTEVGACSFAWSPLGGGRISVNSNEVSDTKITTVNSVLDDIAQTYGATRAQVAYAFIRQCAAPVIPIIGSTKRKRVSEAVAAEGLRLERRQWYRIVEAYRGSPMP